MKAGDIVYIKSELKQGHVEGFEITSEYKATLPLYDWWLRIERYGEPDSFAPYKESELTLDHEIYSSRHETKR